MRALYFLQEHGVDIPQEVSVVGHDDTVMSGFTSPRVTTVGVPTCEMATNGCRWLLNQCFDMSLDVHRHFPIDVNWSP